MVRDTQRQRVYNAETYMPRGQTWATIADVQAYVDRLLASALWRRLCPSVTKVVITPARWNAVWSRAYSDKTGGTIRLAAGHYDQLLLFHELAHLAQPPNTAWHGPEFCLIYLRLVYHWMGDRIGGALEERFKAHQVQVALSAVPLRRICLRLHGAVRQRVAFVWRAETTDPLNPMHRWIVPRTRVWVTVEPHAIPSRRRRERPRPRTFHVFGHEIGDAPMGTSVRVRGGRRPRPGAQRNIHTLELFGRPGGVRPRVRCGGGDDAGQMSLEAFLAAYCS
jgi:putative metallohydrolase (TIGR04338 family)